MKDILIKPTHAGTFAIATVVVGDATLFRPIVVSINGAARPVKSLVPFASVASGICPIWSAAVAWRSRFGSGFRGNGRPVCKM